MFPPPQLEQTWQRALEGEWSKPYLQELARFLSKERSSSTPVYPPKQDVFNAFNQTPFDQVKIVVIGQDPYHGPSQAHGLSFSVPHGVAQPPSLRNIFREMEDDVQIRAPKHGCLIGWAKQGVLLLNAVLTVRAHEPASHQGKGWECFTDEVVSQICKRKDPVVFVLWGKYAQAKCQKILAATENRHFILAAAHPSPHSVLNFCGCRHFSKINEILTRQGKEPINWDLN